MAQLVMVLAAKPEELCSVPKTYMVKGENQQQAFF